MFILFKMITRTPLPFQGNKSVCRKEVIEVLSRIDIGEDTVFVDLFGGSLYLSYLVKSKFPGCNVVCNDYDNYCERLRNIPDTNRLLSLLREVLKDVGHGVKLSDEQRESVREVITSFRESGGFVDYITIASSLFYSGLSAGCADDLLKNNALYNRVRDDGYDEQSAERYIEGIDIVRLDWTELFERYKGRSDVVFIADPPYGKTYCGGYKCEWNMADTYKTLRILKEERYLYFTSSKTGIRELLEYLNDEYDCGYEFEVVEVNRGRINKHRNVNLELILYRG